MVEDDEQRLMGRQTEEERNARQRAYRRAVRRGERVVRNRAAGSERIAGWVGRVQDIERVLCQLVEGDTSRIDPDTAAIIERVRRIEGACEGLRAALRCDVSQTLAALAAARAEGARLEAECKRPEYG